MCYKFLACESKMASIFSGQFSRLPTELPTISILDKSGLPTELHTELPTISVYGRSGQPNLHCKIPMGSPWAVHSTAHLAAHFFTFGSSWLPSVSIYGSSGQPNLHGEIPMGSQLRCPLSCPLFPYMEVVGSLLSCQLSCPLFPYIKVVGSLICMSKFPWAAHGQPTPLPTCSPLTEKWAAPLFFFSYGNSFQNCVLSKVPWENSRNLVLAQQLRYQQIYY